MSSTNETGHAKNVANLDLLISSVTSFGTQYNPSKASLKLPALQTLSGNAHSHLLAVNTALSAYKTATAARDVAFSGLSPLVTRVRNAVVATDTSDQVKIRVNEIIRKITGQRTTPKKTEEEKQELAAKGKKTKEISSSQMSFDNRLNNFDMLIKLLSTIPQYTPNEADLKITALSTVHNDLKAKNTACLAAHLTLKNVRLTRNTLFYKEKTGLVDTAINVKTYVKSVFSASSPQYKQISRLKFVTVQI